MLWRVAKQDKGAGESTGEWIQGRQMQLPNERTKVEPDHKMPEKSILQLA